MNRPGENGTTWIFGLLMLASAGCKRHYNPPAITAPNNYLVVEGVIAAGSDSTIITLSRSVNLSQQIVSSPERNATVSVVSDQGDNYPLTEVDTGRYGAAPLNLDASRKYALHIATTDGRVYASSYEPVKITPPVDTLGYNITNDGLNIYVNTHDPSNNVQYYRWDYAETYIYESEIASDFILDLTKPDGQEAVLRTPQQQVHICYVTANSSTVLINSTAALKQSVIQNNMITQIPKDSEKIVHRYSINVKEYALTDSAYQFWSTLQRNTQNIGSIFDVQPSEVSSNLHCISNPSEPVIGYISVSSITQKRIFIDRSQLPVWPVPQGSCLLVNVCWPLTEKAPPQELTSGDLLPVTVIHSTVCGNVAGYIDTVATFGCADCRYHLGGKTMQPAFWK